MGKETFSIILLALKGPSLGLQTIRILRILKASILS
jgi:hypothetical protein